MRDCATRRWNAYLVAFDKPDKSGVSAIWSPLGHARCAHVHPSGSSLRAVDKHDAPVDTRRTGFADGDVKLRLPAATAQSSYDPADCYFIGGDPILLVESDVDPTAPVEAPILSGIEDCD